MTNKQVRVYNLSNIKDREELIKHAIDIDDSQLLTIHDRMFKDGYRGDLSKLDKIFYRWLGKEAYNVLSSNNMEYSCLEADYLHIEKHGTEFRILCKVNRQMMWEESKHLLPELLIGVKIARLRQLSRNEMIANIRRKYKSYKPTKLLLLENIVKEPIIDYQI
jgi:hypothetical protein